MGRGKKMDEKQKRQDIPELHLKKNILGRWSTFFIDRYRVTFLLIIVVLFWGGMKYVDLKREAQPEVTIPYVFVSTSYVGASPQEVETLITDPIEEKLEELDDIREISSTSGFGHSTVVLELEPGEDVDEKVREAREKMSELSSQLPGDAEIPAVSYMKTGESPILIFSLSGDYDVLALQESAKAVKERIEKVEGVKEVGLIGNRKREIAITIDPQKLSVYGISLQQINQALSSSNINFPGGDATLNDLTYNIRTVGRFDSIEDIENTLIRYTENGQIYLKDIAKVKDTYEDIDVYVRKAHGLNSNQAEMKNAISIAVKRKESVDDITVRDNVLEMLSNNSDDLYPENMELKLLSDKAEYVDDVLGTVIDNAKSGLILVIVVLFLFIGFGESIIVSLVIPLSIFAAFGLMNVTGMTLNNISMFSLVLAVGMLVDNAIVVMENIDRLRYEGLTAREAAEAGTNQIAPAIMASTLTTLAAFFPMALTSGIMGDFIRPIPMTVIFTLVASFFMAITVTPSVCSVVLKKHRSKNKNQHPILKKVLKVISVVFIFLLSMIAFKDWEKTGMSQYGLLSYVMASIFAVAMFIKQFKAKGSHKEQKVIRIYVQILSWIIDKTKRKWTVMTSIFLLFILSVALIPMGILKVEMFGDSDYPFIFVNINTPQGSKLEDTYQIVEQVEKKLLKVDEIEYFISYVGNEGASIWSDLSLESQGQPNQAKISIQLYDKKQRQRSSMEIADALRESFSNIAGADIAVDELEDGPPMGAPVDITLKGEDLDALEYTANDFARILNSIDGVRDIDTSIGETKPELQIRVNKQKAAALGLNDQTIAFAVRNAVNGFTATTYRDGQDEIDVVIRTSNQRLKTTSDLKKIFIYNPMGKAIPLSQVTEFIETQSSPAIYHIDGKRRVSVFGKVREGLTAKEVVEVFDKKIETYPLANGIEIEYGGEEEAMGDSFGDMMVNMVIAAILVFIILAVQFNSLSQPFIILFTVPLALIGVMPGLAFTGHNFGFVSFVGLVALVGIAVNDAIVLVDYINYLRKCGYEMKDAIIETGTTRFLPVLATTITTAGGILPLTIKDPFFAPMGIALISGLCMASVLTLVIIPTMYSLFEGRKLKLKTKKNKKAQATEL